MKRALATWVFLVCASPALAQEPWGYELPNFGKDARIIALYRSQAGAIVMEFSYGEKNNRLADFYDTGLKKRIAPERAREIAETYQVEDQIAAAHHMVKIPWRMRVVNSARTQFDLEEFSGSGCHFPYDTALTITRPSERLQDHMILWKLPKPDSSNDYGCRHHDTLGSSKLRLRWRPQNPNMYWSTGTDMYYALHDVPWLVRFDAGGQTRFFDQRSDLVMMRAEKIGALVKGMAGAGRRKVQAAINTIEAMIDASATK